MNNDRESSNFNYKYSNNVILHQNIASAITKSDEIEIVLNELLVDTNLKIHFICLSETFILSGEESNLQIGNYVMGTSFSSVVNVEVCVYCVMVNLTLRT